MADEMMASVKGLLDLLDPSKIDKAKLKSAVSLAADSMKPATSFFADLDDMLWDQLKNVANMFIDKLGVPVVNPTVGDTNYTASDVDAYLGAFGGTINEEVREKLRKKPKLLNIIKKEFSQEEQAKLVGNPFLIALLSIFGPLIIEWVKKWLSK